MALIKKDRYELGYRACLTNPLAEAGTTRWSASANHFMGQAHE